MWSRIAKPIETQQGATLLAFTLLVASLFSVIQAIVKPFWFDEVCTVILCRLPNASDIWRALNDAADTNPPLFYFIARFARHFIADDHVAYRLPSIFGLCGSMFCLYLILSDRLDRLAAMVGTAFVLHTPLADYAREARPYALMVGCVSGAILAWQRLDRSRFYPLLLAFMLAFSTSLHYYAIFVWPAFMGAEVAAWISRRKFRLKAWAALISGLVPLFLMRDLVLHLRSYYGRNFWAPVQITQSFTAYDWLFGLDKLWGCALTLVLGASVVYWTTDGKTSGSLKHSLKLRSGLRMEEAVLASSFVLLPGIAVMVAELSHGGMAERYMLPAVLGAAVIIGCLASKVPPAFRFVLLGAMLMSYSLTSIRDVNSGLNGALLAKRTAAIREVDRIVAEHGRANLPIIISSGLQYLPMAYYNPVDRNRELYALTDPKAALEFTKTDSIDLALIVLRKYFPLQVEDYHAFACDHRKFVLVSANLFDWWPSRLLRDGHDLKLISTDGHTRIYRVTLKP